MTKMNINEVLSVVQGEATANHDDLIKLTAIVESLSNKVDILMTEMQSRTQPSDFPPVFNPAEQGYTKGGQ